MVTVHNCVARDCFPVILQNPTISPPSYIPLLLFFVGVGLLLLLLGRSVFMSHYLEVAGVGLARHARRVQFGEKVSKSTRPMPGDKKDGILSGNSDVDLENAADADMDI